jgi:tripartite-type tricarboxylate transporter receptor subunit TctC
MKYSSKSFFAAALAVFFAVPGPATAASPAAGLPKGPVTLVVPFAPGGGVDTAARLLAKQLGANTGISVIVENRGGGSGIVGGNAVKSASPDGQTLLFSASTHVLAKEVISKAPYDPVRDFAPVARVAEAPLLMVIAPSLPQRNIRDVLSAAKQEPEKWTAALPAYGSASHIGTLLLAKQGGVQLTTVSYRGTAPALADVAGGHAQILVDSIVSVLPMTQSGKVQAIATTSARRTALAPTIPTAAEGGFPDLVYSSWYGVWAPPGTPGKMVESWNKAINSAMNDLARAGTLASLGLEPVTESVEQFRQFIDADVKRSAGLLHSSGFKPE